MPDFPSTSPSKDDLSGLDLFGLIDVALHPPESAWIPSQPEELAGQIPQCEITEMLGRGGMGAVYLARQTLLARQVAVKILPPEADPDEKMAERFRREGRILARLTHPHIVAIFDSGTTPDGHLFIVMELATGGDLAKRMQAGRLPAAEAVRILLQVGSAVGAAHEQSVLHRDLKPSNVLLMSDGTAKVADFGLAVPLQVPESERLTREHTTVGTAEYAAPEQFSAKKGGPPPDQRADIYSMGVLAYELFTGELPRGVFEPPSSISGLDPAVDAVVLQALQSDPQRRFASAGDFCAALTAAMDRGVQQERRDRESRIQLRQRTRMAAAFGSLAVLAGGAAVYGWIQKRAAENHAAEARSQKAEATTARGEAEQLVAFMLGDVGEKLERSGQLDLLEDVVAGAGRYYENRASAAPDDWLAQTQRAAFLQTQSSVLAGRGKATESLEQLRESLRICQAAVDAQPEDYRWHAAWFSAQRKLGGMLKMRSANEEALTCFQTMEKRAEACIAQFPDAPKPHFFRAVAVIGTGDVLSYLKRYNECADAYRKAGRLLDEIENKHPGDRSVRSEQIGLHASFGSLWEQLGRLEDALAEFRRYDLAVRYQATARGGNWDHELSHSKMRVAVALKKLGRPGEARPVFEEATVLAERSAAAHPGDAGRLLILEFLYGELGGLVANMGETALAEEYKAKGKRLEELRKDPLSDPKRASAPVLAMRSKNEIDALFATLSSAAATLDDARRWAKASTVPGDSLSRSGDARAALDHYTAWAGRLEDKLRAEPHESKWAVALSSTLNRQASLWVKTEPALALKAYERALELRRPVAEALPDDAEAQRDLISSLGHVLELRTAISEPEAILNACAAATAACAKLSGSAIAAGNFDQWISVNAAAALRQVLKLDPTLKPQVQLAAAATLSALFDRPDAVAASPSAQAVKARDALRELAR